MTDVVDSLTRSRMMAGIQGKNTKPEILIRSLLHRHGFRFRIHERNLQGKPDIVLKKYNAIIFVHGCFWHMHQCNLFKWPQTRPDFWRNKISRNHENDLKVTQSLSHDGWRICIIWECSIKGANRDIAGVLEKVTAWLKGDNKLLIIPE